MATNVIDELASVDKGLLRKASQDLAGMQLLLETRLRRAKEQGEFRPDTDVEMLASLLMVTLQGLVVLSMSTKDVASMRRARDFVIGVLENSSVPHRGAVRDVVGIWSGAISDIVKLSGYAARSIG